MREAMYQEFYIQKNPQSFDETLAAFGLAEVLADLLERQGGDDVPITITDEGYYLHLHLATPLLVETITTHTRDLMPAEALATEKTKLPEGIFSVQYETVKARVQSYFAAPKEARETMALPPLEWDIYRAINPASLPGYNGMMTDWFQVRAEPEVLIILFDLYSTLPNDFDAAHERWKQLAKERGWNINQETTRQQLYNPDSGKGQNKVKANGLSISNVKSFWLTEWLKAVGFYHGALTKSLRGVKDRKTIVFAPRKLTYQQHRQIRSRFVESMRIAETSVRFDVLAVIRYAKALLEYILDTDDSLLALLGMGQLKQTVMSGFHTAFYKDMGNAVATMNLSFIALPGWIIVETQDEAQTYQEILRELEQVTRQFDESHSDDFNLLQHLRDFISGDDLDALFRFTSALPAYIMGKRERNQYARQLTTSFIERIIMSTDVSLARILKSEGFQNIAYAIRQATITAQYRKKKNDKKYNVRYGLGQELARKSRYPADFIVVLADFLHKYNAENAQVMETRPKPYRRSIQTSDIDEIVQLIDEYGSETVANLLIAYGHARIPRDEAFNEEDPTESEENNES